MIVIFPTADLLPSEYSEYVYSEGSFVTSLLRQQALRKEQQFLFIIADDNQFRNVVKSLELLKEEWRLVLYEDAYYTPEMVERMVANSAVCIEVEKAYEILNIAKDLAPDSKIFRLSKDKDEPGGASAITKRVEAFSAQNENAIVSKANTSS